MDEGACLAVKNIGKPCAGKPHARFDEGGLMNDNGWLTRSSRERRGVTESLGRDRQVSFLLHPEFPTGISTGICSKIRRIVSDEIFRDVRGK